jgi:hypothetical protein
MWIHLRILPGKQEQETNMSEFKPIETQEQFDARIADRLERDRKGYAKQFEQDMIAKGWKSPEEIATMTADLNKQIEDLNTAAAETGRQMAEKDSEIAANAKYRTDLEKTRIAAAAGLRIDFADRLKGENADEWKQDAEQLAKYIGMSRPSAPLGNPEAGNTNQSTAKQFEAWFNEALGTT